LATPAPRFAPDESTPAWERVAFAATHMKSHRSLLSLIPLGGFRTALLLVSALFTVSGTAWGQIFVASSGGTNGVGKYSLDGTTMSTSLVSGPGTTGMALSGSTLYVTNSGYGTLRVYNFDGSSAAAASIYDPTLASGLDTPYGIAVSGSTVFVTSFNGGTINAYSGITGALSGSFTPITTGLYNPAGLAVSGSSLFVSNASTDGNGNNIKGFTTSGAVLSGFTTITGLQGPIGLAVSGNSLYVANQFNNTIGEYNASTGALINASLGIAGLNQPTGLAVAGNTLYVSQGNGTVGAYDTTTWAAIGITPISGLSGPYGIVATDSAVSAVPEPSTYAAFAGLGVLGVATWRRRKRVVGG
jgi:hypothetical protein